MTPIDDQGAPVARNPRREAQEVVGDADQRAAALAFRRRGGALLEP
jgi:hypothetical protein